MNAVVVVQKLLTRWEKSGRGHPIATMRANLPSALELPPLLLDGPVAYHCVTYLASGEVPTLDEILVCEEETHALSTDIE